MSKRAVVIWHVVYGIVSIFAGCIAYNLFQQGRLFDAVGIMLMAAAAMWVSMSNFDDPLEPPSPKDGFDSY